MSLRDPRVRKALASTGVELPPAPRKKKYEEGPAIDFGSPQKPQYAKGLVASRPTKLPIIGRKLTNFEQTLQALGARAAKSEQQLSPPESLPCIAYNTAHEFQCSSGLRRLEALSRHPIEYNSVPYSLIVMEDAVAARVTRSAWEKNSEIEAVRTILGLETMPPGLYEPGQRYHDIPLVRFDSLKPIFSERVEALNRFDMTLNIGQLAVVWH